MKRTVFLYLLMFIFLASGRVAFGQSDAKQVCPFSVSGLWRSDVTTQSTPIFFNFSPEGYVTLLTYSSETLAQDFEVLTAVNYKLDKPAAPKLIEFTATRGNDVFQQGVTSLKITEYGDNNFTTLDPATEQKTRWERVQTHRYFLTFAARSGPLPHGGPAFTLWTVMDGRTPTVEALGLQLIKDEAGKTVPVFEPIPAELYNKIREESEEEKKGKKDENVIMRFELTEAEFESTHKIYEMWAKYVETKTLPDPNPYINEMEFLSKATDGLNQCGEKIKLHKPTQRERAEIVSKNNPSQQALEYIRLMRKANDELHVTDKAFPWSWRPLIQLPGQQ